MRSDDLLVHRVSFSAVYCPVGLINTNVAIHFATQYRFLQNERFWVYLNSMH